MSEDNDLTTSGLSNQASRNGFPMHVVERGNRIIEYDARPVFGCCELGHERSQSNAAMFALAQDLSNCSRRPLCKRDFEARNTLNAVLLSKFHSEASDIETRHLPSKLCS